MKPHYPMREKVVRGGVSEARIGGSLHLFATIHYWIECRSPTWPVLEAWVRTLLARPFWEGYHPDDVLLVTKKELWHR